MKKVTISERVHTPAARGPRFMVWAFGILGAPFTGGLSLLAAPLYEAGVHAERRNAADALDRAVPEGPVEAAKALGGAVRNGVKGATVRYGARTDGWGYVEKEVHCRIDED